MSASPTVAMEGTRQPLGCGFLGDAWEGVHELSRRASQGRVRQLRVQCVFCVHIIFLRHCARGLTAVAKLDRPSAPLSPLAQTKCLIVTAAGRHSSHSAGPILCCCATGRPTSSLSRTQTTSTAGSPSPRRSCGRRCARRSTRQARKAHLSSRSVTVSAGRLRSSPRRRCIGRPAAPSAASTRSGCRGSARAILPAATTARSAKGRSGSSTATISSRAFRSPHSASGTSGDCLTCPRFGQFNQLVPTVNSLSNEPRIRGDRPAPRHREPQSLAIRKTAAGSGSAGARPRHRLAATGDGRPSA